MTQWAETEALQPLWPLNRLDSSRIGSLWLVLMLLLPGVMLGLGYAYLVHLRVPEIFAPSYFVIRVFSFAQPLMGISLHLVVAVVMARATERSIRRLLEADAAVLDVSLVPSQRMITVCFFLALATGMLFTAALGQSVSREQDQSATQQFMRLLEMDLLVVLNAYLLWPVYIATFGYVLVVLIGQYKVLNDMAQRLHIDLTRLNHFNAISEPFVRLVILTAATISLTQLIGLYQGFEDARVEVATLVWSALLLVVLGIPALIYLMPIWTLRKRIRDVKQQQLELVAAALAGDADAIQAVYAKTPVERISESDLLTRQMFIESRWEWPIAAHVQQLILFGLLPPMTWVLAAVVENLLY